MVSSIELITPEWCVPDHVHARVTSRSAGLSKGKFEGLNLANHVGDSALVVEQNRHLLSDACSLPSNPYWLNQTHSSDVVKLPTKNTIAINADASWTNTVNTVCVVLTADCLPVFFYHQPSNSIAVVHAGWRGLADGVLENTIQEMTSSPEQIVAWLGPAIGPAEFEVGEEVRDIFCNSDPDAQECFVATNKKEGSQHYLADIYRLAKRRLYNAGVISVTGGDFCTVQDSKRFYSYRRDGETGRMASLIWLSDS